MEEVAAGGLDGSLPSHGLEEAGEGGGFVEHFVDLIFAAVVEPAGEDRGGRGGQAVILRGGGRLVEGVDKLFQVEPFCCLRSRLAATEARTARRGLS